MYSWAAMIIDSRTLSFLKRRKNIPDQKKSSHVAKTHVFQRISALKDMCFTGSAVYVLTDKQK